MRNEAWITFYLTYSIAQFNNAIAINPGYINSYSNLARAYFATKQYNRAVETINKETGLDPKYENDLPYEVLAGLGNWNYGQGGRGYLNVADELRTAMMKTPHLKVMFCSGYYDLATPYFSTNYTVDHMDLGKELRENISMKRFVGGHMMYHVQKSLRELKGDIAEFMGSAVPKK